MNSIRLQNVRASSAAQGPYIIVTTQIQSEGLKEQCITALRLGQRPSGSVEVDCPVNFDLQRLEGSISQRRLTAVVQKTLTTAPSTLPSLGRPSL